MGTPDLSAYEKMPSALFDSLKGRLQFTSVTKHIQQQVESPPFVPCLEKILDGDQGDEMAPAQLS